MDNKSVKNMQFWNNWKYIVLRCNIIRPFGTKSNIFCYNVWKLNNSNETPSNLVELSKVRLHICSFLKYILQLRKYYFNKIIYTYFC